MAIGGPVPTRAAKSATTTIPIVFAYGGDPVGDGLVASFNRPGGNVTGASFMGASSTSKRLQVLKQLLPQAVDVALLLNPKATLPALYDSRDYVEKGGLISYGSVLTDTWRQAGLYVGRILKGEKPQDLPVVQPTRFETVINLKTAKVLGLEVPPGVLALADDTIE